MNPFEQRATEYLRDDEAFLAIISPEPLNTHFRKPAEDDRLYKNLAIMFGTPGSGKTTLARLFQFSTLTTLLSNGDAPSGRPLLDAMIGCHATDGIVPLVLGARIPLESEYREIWEFPYTDELKSGLMTSLLQARTVLIWLRSLENAGYDLNQITIQSQPGAAAALEAIGGEGGEGLMARARAVEAAIYRISAALIPPTIDQMQEAALLPYHPFDVIETIDVSGPQRNLSLKPLAIFDDAHSLHPHQFAAMRDWLAQREIRIARWILTRLDSLVPSDLIQLAREHSGESPAREILSIPMQGVVTRGEERKRFAKIANDMTRRYLAQMNVFSTRHIRSLQDMVTTEPPTLSAKKTRELEQAVQVAQEQNKVTPQRRATLERQIDDYFNKRHGQHILEQDLRLAMTKILIHRYAKRTPQMGLFGENEIDPEPARPMVVDSGLVDAARVFLMRKYDRPYYYGMQTLSQAASENAELLLQFSAELVSRLETLCIRRKPPSLTPATQHKLIMDRAQKIIAEWNFPTCLEVKRLCSNIAAQCAEKTDEPNASLNGGATGIGIPMSSFDTISEEYPALAQTLKFGIAYNAFSILPNRSVKGKNWLILDLSGPYRVASKFTLRHGNFLERTLVDLVSMHEGRE